MKRILLFTLFASLFFFLPHTVFAGVCLTPRLTPQFDAYTTTENVFILLWYGVTSLALLVFLLRSSVTFSFKKTVSFSIGLLIIVPIINIFFIVFFFGGWISSVRHVLQQFYKPGDQLLYSLPSYAIAEILFGLLLTWLGVKLTVFPLQKHIKKKFFVLVGGIVPLLIIGGCLLFQMVYEYSFPFIGQRYLPCY